jgi:VanZ family protein
VDEAPTYQHAMNHKQGISLKLKRNWTILFSLYFLFLLTVIISAYRGILPVELEHIPFYDTVGHFLLLGIASYLGHKALDGQMFKIRFFPVALPLAPVLITMFIAIEESFQLLSPLRTASLVDMTANLIGIWGFYWLATRK